MLTTGVPHRPFYRATRLVLFLANLLSVCLAQLAPGHPTQARDESAPYSLFVQTSHGGHYLRKLVLDHRGQQLASVATDGEVKIWNLASKQETWSFRNVLGVTNTFCSPIAFSPDDETLAVGADRTVQLVSLTTGEVHHVDEDTFYPPTSLVFSRDGKQLAIGRMTGRVSVITLSTGENSVLSEPTPPSTQEILQYQAQGKLLPYVSSLFFEESSGALFAALSTGRVESFNVPTKKIESTQDVDGIIMHFGESAGVVIAGGTDFSRTSARVWNLPANQLLVNKRPCFIQVDIDYLSISEHGNLALTRCEAEDGSGVYEIWQLPSGRPRSLGANVRTLAMNGPSIISDDGSLIAISNAQKAITIAGVDGLNLPERLEQSPVDSVAGLQSIPATGELVVSTADEVAIWKTIPTTEVQIKNVNKGHAAFSGDGKWMAYFDDQGKLLLVDRKSNQVVATPITEAKVINNFVYRMVMSPIGPTVSWITGAGFGGYAKYWKNGDKRSHIVCQSDHEGDLAVSAKGTYIAVGCNHYSFPQKSSSEVHLYAVNSMTVLDSVYGDLKRFDLALPIQSSVTGLAFATDEARYAVNLTAEIQIRATNGKQKPVSIPNDLEHQRIFYGPLTFSNNNTVLAVQQINNLVGQFESGGTGMSEQVSLIATSDGHIVAHSALDAFCTAMVTFRQFVTVGLSDGRTILYDTKTLSPQVTLLHPDGWLAVTRDGWFDGNAEALHWVGWRASRQKDIVPLDFLYDTYYLPNVLSDILDGSYKPPERTIGEELGIGSLQLMVEQGYFHIEHSGDGLYLCFSSPQTTDVDVYSDGAPISFASNAIRRGVSATCPWRARLPEGALKIENRNPRRPDSDQHCPPVRRAERETSGNGVLRVLTVAVGEYSSVGSEGRPLASLPSSVPSAAALEKLFKSQPKGPGEHFRDIVVLPGLRSGSVPPTLANIKTSLHQLASLSAPEDTVFLFFSGHGYIPPGNQMFYFAPAEFDLTSLSTIRRTGLNVPMIADILREIPARNIVLIIDACQSGGALTSLARMAQLRVARGSRKSDGAALGVDLLASATALQMASALPSDEVGPLAKIIVDAADPKKSRVSQALSAGQLLESICSELPSTTGQTPLLYLGGRDFPLIKIQN
jgi:WD40 repeat protein